MHLENILLNERKQYWGLCIVQSDLYEISRIGKSMETENTPLVAKGWENIDSNW